MPKKKVKKGHFVVIKKGQKRPKRPFGNIWKHL